jgi:hypothetical protein
VVVRLKEPESPRMSLTLDAVENNGLSPSLGGEHALHELVSWLQEFGVEHVAMESMGPQAQRQPSLFLATGRWRRESETSLSGLSRCLRCNSPAVALMSSPRHR